MNMDTTIQGRQLLRWGTAALLVMAASSASAQQYGELETTSTLQEATAIAERLVAQRANPVVAALEQVESKRLALELADLPAVREEEPAVVSAYAESIGSLGRHPSAETLSALTVAIQHEEPSVRLAGLTALREGASQGQPNSAALMTARTLVTSDADSRIRRQAFEAYCRWGDQDDVLVLAQTLGREPGPVRDLAVREWLRIERERQ